MALKTLSEIESLVLRVKFHNEFLEEKLQNRPRPFSHQNNLWWISAIVALWADISFAL